MAEIIRKAIKAYNIVFYDWTDPRTNSWFLVAKPYEGLILLGLYLFFVLKLGPKWMKNRAPFNVNKLMIAYNILQVFLCAYIFVEATKAWGQYKLFCEPIDYSESKDALNAVNITYLYYISKLLDLIDTIFFVLRKKFSQISFLHVYHHTGMVMLIWGGITYLPGGHGTSVGLINSFVHVVMYSYYLLTIVFPQVKYSLRWKKYVTQIQIIQFFLCVVHIGSLVFIPDCAYPRWVVTVFLPQNLFMLVLFVDFYIKTYIKKPKENILVISTKTNGTKENIECYSNNEKTGDLQFHVDRIDDSKLLLRKVNQSEKYCKV
ncbi:unnamed protein product, partial [Brenthis ino]